MKNFLNGLIALNLLFIVGCKKNDLSSTQNSQNQTAAIEMVKNAAAPKGVLKFKSKEELGTLLEKIKKENLSLDGVLSAEFRSLKKKHEDFKNKYPNIDEIKFSSASTESENSQSTEMELFNYDLENYISPLEEMQFILNEEMQFIIGQEL